MKRMPRYLVILLVIWGSVVVEGLSAGITFSSRSSAIELKSGANFTVGSAITGVKGLIIKDSNATISGSNISFENGTFEEDSNAVVLTADLNSTTGNFVLNGSKRLQLKPGISANGITVSGDNNRLEGQPVLSSAITFDANATLTLAIQSSLNQNIQFDSGGTNTILLDSDVSLADDVTIVNDGTIDINGRAFSFGGKTLTFANHIYWLNAGDTRLWSKTIHNGTWTYNVESRLNCNGNVVDVSGGGVFDISSSVTLHIADAIIIGVTGSTFAFGDNGSTVNLSNVTIQIDEDISFSKGRFYVEGPTTFVMHDHDWTFGTDSKLTISAVSLWLDKAGAATTGELLFGSASNYEFVNSGTYLEVGSGSGALASWVEETSDAMDYWATYIEANSDWVSQFGGLVEENSNWVNSYGDLVIENSNWVNSYGDLVIENSNWINGVGSNIEENSDAIVYWSTLVEANSDWVSQFGGLVEENSNWVNSYGDLVIENSNWVNSYGDLVIENSNWINGVGSNIEENSDAIVYWSTLVEANSDWVSQFGGLVEENSNWVNSYGDLVIENSNWVNSYGDLVVENSTAVDYWSNIIKGSEVVVTDDINATSGNIALDGNKRLRLSAGITVDGISVSNSNNRLEGHPILSDVITFDPNATLTLALCGPLNQNIQFDSGGTNTILLDGDVVLSDDVTIVNDGTIDINGRVFSFGGKNLTFANHIYWLNAGDTRLWSKTIHNGTWTYNVESRLNCNGNVIDVSGGGVFDIKASVTLHIADAIIIGVTDSTFVFGDNGSTLNLSNVEIQIDEDVSFAQGRIYVDGPTTFIMHDNNWTFGTDSMLTISAISLWLDGAGAATTGELLFDSAGNYEFVNSGTYLEVGSGGGLAGWVEETSDAIDYWATYVEANSNWIDAYGDLVIENSNWIAAGGGLPSYVEETSDAMAYWATYIDANSTWINQYGDLVIENSNWVDSYGDLVIENSNWIDSYGDLVIDNSNWIDGVSDLLQQHSEAIYYWAEVIKGKRALLLSELNSAIENISLSGSERLRLDPGLLVNGISVSGTNNRIEKLPLLSGPITFDANATLTLAINGPINQNIQFDSSGTNTIRLEGNVSLCDDVTIVNDGTINVNGRVFAFGGKPLTLSNTIYWENAGDIRLWNKLDFNGTYAFKNETVLNGNGNVIDVSGGGVFDIWPSVTFHMTDVTIVGATDSTFVFQSNGSTMRLSNVTIQIDEDVSLARGRIYVDGPTTFVMHDHDWTFGTDSKLTISAVSLWLDKAGAATIGELLFDGASNYELVNSGTYLEVGAGGSLASWVEETSDAIDYWATYVDANSTWINQYGDLVQENSNWVNSYGDLVIENSNWVNSYGDLVIENSNWIAAGGGLPSWVEETSDAMAYWGPYVEANSNWIDAYGDLVIENSNWIDENSAGPGIPSWVEETSDAMAYWGPYVEANSNWIDAYGDLVIENSNWIDENSAGPGIPSWVEETSDAMAYWGPYVEANSNWIDAYGDLVIENSNWIAAGGGMPSWVEETSDAMDYWAEIIKGNDILFVDGLNSTTGRLVLGGNKRLRLDPGVTVSGITVRNSNNRIEKQPLLSDVISFDADATLTLALNGPLNQNIQFDSGGTNTILLEGDVSLADDVTIVNDGTIDVNGRSFAFGGRPLTFTNTIHWLNAGDIRLWSKTIHNGTFNINSETQLNANCNVIDVSGGGIFDIKASTTLHIADAIIIGMTDSTFVFGDNGSTVNLSNVTIQIDEDISLSQGRFYVEGPTTFVLHDHDWTFGTDSKLTISAVSLWLDKAGAATAGELLFDDASNYELINSGTYLQMGAGLVDLVEANSNWINQYGDVVTENSNWVNSYGDLVIENSNWVNSYGDLVIENSNWVNSYGDLVIENSNWVNSYGDLVIENSNWVNSYGDLVIENSNWIDGVGSKIEENSDAIDYWATYVDANSTWINQYGDLVIENSNWVNSYGDLVIENSNWIDAYGDLVIENSNWIAAGGGLPSWVEETSDAMAHWGPYVEANSNWIDAYGDLVIENSNWIDENSAGPGIPSWVEETSDAMAYWGPYVEANSNWINAYGDLVIENSNWIDENSAGPGIPSWVEETSDAMAYWGPYVEANSNWIDAYGDLVIENSNWIAAGGGLPSWVEETSDAMDYWAEIIKGNDILFVDGLNSTTGRLVLDGNKRLRLDPGVTVSGITVRNSNNRIEKQPLLSDVISFDADATLTLALNGPLNQNIQFDSGGTNTILLEGDVSLADDVTIVNDGTIDVNGRSFAFGGRPLTFTNTIHWLNAGDIRLWSKTIHNGTFNINSETQLNANCNVIDVSGGGTFDIKASTTLHIADAIIIGVTDSTFVFGDNGSTVNLSNVTIQIDEDISLSQGRFYVEGPTTFVLHDHDWTFGTDSKLTISAVSLWLDKAGAATAGELLFDDASNYELINSGTYLQMGAGLVDLVEENSNWINQYGDVVIENSNWIDSYGDLVIENSNWINQYGDLVIDNSDCIAEVCDLVIENSNWIDAYGDLVIENSNWIAAGGGLPSWVEETSDAMDYWGPYVEANSNWIDAYGDLVIENSNWIAAGGGLPSWVEETSDAMDYWADIIKGNSDCVAANCALIVENSNWIDAYGDLVIENSNWISENPGGGGIPAWVVETSNWVHDYGDLVIENSNCIDESCDLVKANSNWIDSYGDLVIENSNWIDQYGDLVIENSNWISENPGGAGIPSWVVETSDAMDYWGDIIKANSDCVAANCELIVENSNWINQYGDLVIENSNTIINIYNTFGDDVHLLPGEFLEFNSDQTLDGDGRMFVFSMWDQPQFIIGDGVTLTLKNIELIRINANTFSLGEGAKLVIDENVLFELNEDLVWNYGSFQITGDDTVFTVRGLGKNKKLTFYKNCCNRDWEFDLGSNTLCLHNVELDGLHYLDYSSRLRDRVLPQVGAIALAGDSVVNVRYATRMNFVVSGDNNQLSLRNNNIWFMGSLSYGDLFDNELKIKFLLEDMNGQTLQVIFGEDFAYVASVAGLARLIFTDATVQVLNKSESSFVLGRRAYLGGQNVEILDYPIKQISPDVIFDPDLNLTSNCDNAIEQEFFLSPFAFRRPTTAFHNAGMKFRGASSLDTPPSAPLPAFAQGFGGHGGTSGLIAIENEYGEVDFDELLRSVRGFSRCGDLHIHSSAIKLSKAKNAICVNRGKINDFGISADEQLSLTMINGATIEQENHDVELKEFDKICVEGVNNKIIVKKNFVIKGSLLFDEGAELTFEFGQGKTIPEIYFDSTTNKLLKISRGATLLFKGRGKVRFSDGYTIYFDGKQNKKESGLVIQDLAEMVLDDGAECYMSGNGQILVHNKGKLHVGENRHVIVGLHESDVIDIAIDREGEIFVEGVRGQQEGKFSMQLGSYAIEVSSKGRLHVGRNGLFEINSLDRAESRGYLSSLLFQGEGKLKVDGGGLMLFGRNRCHPVTKDELALLWDNVEGIGALGGMIGFSGGGSIGRLQDVRFGSEMITIDELVSRCLNIASHLSVSIFFIDEHGRNKLRTKNGVIVNLLAGDEVLGDAPESGNISIVNRGEPFVITADGQRI